MCFRLHKTRIIQNLLYFLGKQCNQRFSNDFFQLPDEWCKDDNALCGYGSKDDNALRGYGCKDDNALR